jgi:TfoX/Sxy family transcriptional regulator of competence genes
MAYDEGLAYRIREVLAEESAVSEKKMFGGLSFLFNGNMAVGVIQQELVVRVSVDDNTEALSKAHTRPMDFSGRPMKGWIYVAAEGLSDDRDLAYWIRAGVDYAKSLPPKSEQKLKMKNGK